MARYERATIGDLYFLIDSAREHSDRDNDGYRIVHKGCHRALYALVNEDPLTGDRHVSVQCMCAQMPENTFPLYEPSGVSERLGILFWVDSNVEREYAPGPRLVIRFSGKDAYHSVAYPGDADYDTAEPANLLK